MANYRITFHDLVCDEDFITCKSNVYLDEESEKFKTPTPVIDISGYFEGKDFLMSLDIPTAIKFAKTIRTEINKAKEGLSNG